MITPADVAISQIGVHEATGHNDGVPSERYQTDPFWTPARPESERVRQVAWCSLELEWCYRTSDWGSFCGTRGEWWSAANALNVGHMLDDRGWRVGIEDVQPSDIIIWERRLESDRKTGHGAGHAGMAVATTPIPLHVVTVEGNIGNAVKPMLRDLSLPGLFGVFRMPESYRRAG